MRQTCRGFSLIETVIVIGLVAGGVLILFGLLSPTLQTVEDHELRRRAKAAADAVIAYLESRGLDQVTEHLLVNEADLADLSAWGGHTLFVDREAERVGTLADIAARGYDRFEQAHFFEAVMVRNSASARWGESGVMGVTLFHLELTWPASSADAAVVPRRHRSRLLVTTALRR